MEKPQPGPSRKERRAQERAQRKQKEATAFSRRRLLRRLAITDAAIGVSGTAIGIARSLEPHIDMLYEKHAASDFEGFAKLIGKKLPGNNVPLQKGWELFAGIDENSASRVRQTGVFERLPR